MKRFIMLLLAGIPALTTAQVGINNTSSSPHASAMLDISSTTRGLLVPRMTMAQRNAIASPATGLMIFQTDNSPGYFYNSGTPSLPAWIKMGDMVLPFSGNATTAGTALLVTNLGTGDGIKSAVTATGKTAIIGEAINQGIVGIASATSGAAYGVQGVSVSTTGSGVTGFASSTTGQNFGVRGLSASDEGKGVYGYNYSPSGLTYGVYGESISSFGYGVYGVGGSRGVLGSGHIGVQGNSTENLGYGVQGFFSSTTYEGTGVNGVSNSPSGIGVKGISNSASGITYGLYGKSYSISGVGVYGTGKTALRGATDEEQGYGVHATCSHATGITRAVFGSVASPNGFSGYFSGGKLYVGSDIGIGTLSPGVRLELQSKGTTTDPFNINFANLYLFRFRHTSNGSGGFYIYDATNTASIFLYGEGNSYINSGRLGIGTSSPTQLLDINGTVRVRSMTTGVVAGTVSRTADGTLITGASDIRLKENIQPLQNSLNKVLQLRGVSFNWKADPQKRRSIGFVAQDFEKVVPELVFTNDNDGFKGINYPELTAVLTEAIKELKAENDFLKARLEKIETLLNKKIGN